MAMGMVIAVYGYDQSAFGIVRVRVRVGVV